MLFFSVLGETHSIIQIILLISCVFLFMNVGVMANKQENLELFLLQYLCQSLELYIVSCLPSCVSEVSKHVINFQFFELVHFPYIIKVFAILCLLDEAAAAGFDLLQFCNLNSYRTKFILGFSIYMGLSVPQYFKGYVITTGRGPVQSGSATVSIYSTLPLFKQHFWHLPFILCAV